jgi:hypothetical protein
MGTTPVIAKQAMGIHPVIAQPAIATPEEGIAQKATLTQERFAQLAAVIHPSDVLIGKD